jgi:protein gp37
MSVRNPKTLGVWGPQGTRVKSASFTKNCDRWNREAKAAGVIRKVFPSICDPFEEWDGPILNASGYELARHVGPTSTNIAPWDSELVLGSGSDYRSLTMDDLRRDLFDTIDRCQNLCFLLLTKRPKNIRRMWQACVGYPDDIGGDGQTYSFHRHNVWLITSISDQATADAMIPELLKCRDLVPVLGVSAEPLLGPIELVQRFKDGGYRNYLDGQFYNMPCKGVNGYPDFTVKTEEPSLPHLDWVIGGGESGHNRRSSEVTWYESLREQCRAAGVSYFQKQDTALLPGQQGRLPLPLWNAKEFPA